MPSTLRCCFSKSDVAFIFDLARSGFVRWRANGVLRRRDDPCATLAHLGPLIAALCCDEARGVLRSLLFARYLRALLARLGEPDGNGLLSALHLRMAALARLQRPALGSVHRALHGLARARAILSLPRPFFRPTGRALAGRGPLLLCRHFEHPFHFPLGSMQEAGRAPP